MNRYSRRKRTQALNFTDRTHDGIRMNGGGMLVPGARQPDGSIIRPSGPDQAIKAPGGTIMMRFSSGSNVPGYMPDEPAEHHETFDDAKRCLIAEILRDADQADNEPDAEDLSAFAEDVNLWGSPQSGYCQCRCYFVGEI